MTCSEPVFDRNGKYLYLFGSTDAGPVRDWFSQANADMRSTSAIYLVVLKKGEVSPLARESDEEKAEEASKGESTKRARRAKRAKRAKRSREATRRASTPAATVIDIDGLGARIVALPVPSGDYSRLQGGETGKLFFLRSADGKSSVQQFDLKTRKTETWVPAADAFVVTADAKKLLYRNGPAFHVVVTSKKADGRRGQGQRRSARPTVARASTCSRVSTSPSSAASTCIATGCR